MENNTMQFDSLTIERQLWGPTKGQFLGKIKFSSPSSEVMLQINHETSMRLLEVVSGGVLQSAAEVARMIPQSVATSLENTPPTGIVEAGND